tara:strand:+ start:2758 stop:3093 length:336 start_codon:yes stop_codon:yes gene_type:complete
VIIAVRRKKIAIIQLKIYKNEFFVHYSLNAEPDKEDKSMSSDKVVFRAVADRSRCCGYGLCASICPEVYKLDAEGLVYFDDDKVTPELEEAAREGAEACPAEAIWLEKIEA